VSLSALGDIDNLRQWHLHRNLEAFALRTPDIAGVTVDVLLFPPVEPQEMCDRAVVVKVSNVPVKLACIDDLIALKSAVRRPIDLSDIEHLKRIAGKS